MTSDMDITASRSTSCGIRILQIVISFWIIGTSIVTQFVGWFIEQGIFEGSFNGPDNRWKIFIVYGLAQFIPAALLSLVSREKTQKTYLQSWVFASVFILASSPLRLLPITDSLSLQASQAIILCIMLVCLNLSWRKNYLLLTGSGDKALTPGLAKILTIIAIGAFPWVLFGALGSIWDTIFGIIVGFLFGCLLSQLVLFGVNPPESSSIQTRSFLKPAWIFLLLSVLLTTGLGQNGNQWLVTLTLPAWAGLFSIISRENGTTNPVEKILGLAFMIGCAAAWPLVWFDADEMMLVTAAGEGEAISWAARTAGLSLIITLAMTMVGWIFLRKPWLRSSEKKGFRVAAFLAWMSLAVIYIALGRPGFFGEKLFLIFNDQAALGLASTIEDVQERRQFVYDQLVGKAESSQGNLRDFLERFNIHYNPYYLVNAIEIDGGPVLEIWLENQPGVNRVLSSPRLRPLPSRIPVASGTESQPETLPWNLQMIGVEKVWEKGILGKGIVIGQSDSGVQGDHPELAESYRGKSGNDDYNWFDPWNSSSSPVDIGGHGTHTLGIILGKSVGIAPQAEWIGCVNLARNLGNPALYLDCLQFMLAPFPQDGDPFRDGKPELGAQILNNSWGCPDVEGCDPQALSAAVDALRTAGIFVVASAGNSGYSTCGTISDPPSLYDSAYTVGAITKEGELASFSSIGPVEVDNSLRTKPDIAAPGVDILSSYPNSTYEIASGTSMAGPHVAGVVALMWSANPELIGDIDRTEAILDQTASIYTGNYPPCVDGDVTPNNAVGYGIVNALDAVNLAIGAGSAQLPLTGDRR